MKVSVDREKLHRERINRNMTVDALAKASGVARSTIIGIESGARAKVWERTLFDIAKALGIQPYELELRKASAVQESSGSDVGGGKEKV